MKKVAIIQSNYIPWKGYFDLIRMVDEFILYDDMQFTRRDWRNRNLIKTPQGLKWLTIPVKVKGKFEQKIMDTEIEDFRWANNHWQTFRLFYSKSPHFKDFEPVFEQAFRESKEISHLSQVNFHFISLICTLLKITTKLSWSSDYTLVDGKTERLVGLCQAAGADHYLSGPSAMNYIDGSLFQKAGIGLEFIDYSGYPEYSQLYGKFEPGVTILDLIFNEGPNAVKFMKNIGP